MKNTWNRDDLKSFFRKGQTPSEVHFGYLIDSTVNKMDDGFSKTAGEGLRLAPTGESQNVLSIFQSQSDPYANWQVQLKNDDDRTRGLSFDHLKEGKNGNLIRSSSLVLTDNGNVGIGTPEPRTKLEVGGTLGIHTRIGTYKFGQVPGDRSWHPILEGLKDMHAFEIVARIDGAPKRGKYAFAHAIALSAFGGGKNKIKQMCAYYDWFWDRIEFRWKGNEARNYQLQVRTRSNYGSDKDGNQYNIRFHVTQLWDESVFQAQKP